MPASSLEKFATEVVKKLKQHDFVALFAGGCVRDKLLGVRPKDYDVATSATPDEVRSVFGRRKALAIGESFGVITVLGPKPHQVEVATFRSDGEYSDGRHPDAVTFSSPEEDAHRRDFTINGMFFDPVEDRVIDYVEGKRDLERRVIRAIGDPHERIEEDRLRMLRAVRFAATYQFELEEQTLDAIRRLHDRISSVSQERISHELERMCCHHERARAIRLLAESQLLSDVLPELNTVDEPRFDRMLALLQQLGDIPLTVTAAASSRFALVLAVLFGADGGDLSDKEVTQTCRRMKLSNDIRKSTEWLVRTRCILHNAATMKFSEIQPILVHDDIELAVQLQDAVAAVDQTESAHVERCREELKLPANQLNPAPLLGGDDLVKAGIRPGPAFKEALAIVRNAQLDGLISTTEEALELAHKHLGR